MKINSVFVAAALSLLIALPTSGIAFGKGSISLNYAQAHINDVAIDAAGWSGKTIILDRTVQGQVSLSRNGLSSDEAWNVFKETLDQLNLAPVEYEPGIVNVITKRFALEQTFKGFSARQLAPEIATKKVLFNFTYPEEIKDIVKLISEKAVLNFVFDRNVIGKTQIVPSDNFVTLEHAYKAFQLALYQLGLGLTETPNALVVQPRRTIERQSTSFFVSENSPVKEPSKSVSMKYPEPTDIKQIVDDVRVWSGVTFNVDKSLSGKVQILNTLGSTDAKNAYQLFYTAVKLLGFTIEKNGEQFAIVPAKNG